MGNISIDDEVEVAISERIDRTKFETPQEYINFVLREVLQSDFNTGDEEASPERRIEEQLEDLGYL
jgi:Arc/MetJ-type ribon-helix-helix transcriptional regulator